MIASLTYLVADTYLAALPAIAISLHSSVEKAQRTIAIYFFGFTVSQLIYGPLSDRYGRRKPLLTGITASLLGSLLCCVSSNIYPLILGRFIQGLGIGACSCLGSVLQRDLFSGARLAQIGSWINIYVACIAASGLLLGSYIQHYLHWRVIFFLSFFYAGLIGLLVRHYLPETNLHLNKTAMHFVSFLKNYATVLQNPFFLGYTLCASLSFASVLAYFTVSPFLLQNTLHLSTIKFGWSSFAIALAVSACALINARLVLTHGILRMMGIGMWLMGIASIVFLILMILGTRSLAEILLPWVIFGCGCGFTLANGFAGALSPFTERTGTAGALSGAIHMFLAAGVSALMSGFPHTTAVPLGEVVVGLTIINSLCWRYLNKRQHSERVKR